jgi:hypothetical protein
VQNRLKEVTIDSSSEVGNGHTVASRHGITTKPNAVERLLEGIGRRNTASRTHKKGRNDASCCQTKPVEDKSATYDDIFRVKFKWLRLDALWAEASSVDESTIRRLYILDIYLFRRRGTRAKGSAENSLTRSCG